jgi:hypothetical protein
MVLEWQLARENVHCLWAVCQFIIGRPGFWGVYWVWVVAQAVVLPGPVLVCLL